MLSLILSTVIGATACLPPAGVKHHHRVPAPVASCVAPPVLMCYQADDIDLELIPQPLIYYTVLDATPDVPVEASAPVQYLDGGPALESLAWGYAPRSVPTYTPPLMTKAPEISADGAAAGLTLLVGALAVLTGRRS